MCKGCVWTVLCPLSAKSNTQLASPTLCLVANSRPTKKGPLVPSMYADRSLPWMRISLLMAFAFTHLPVSATLAQASGDRRLDLVCPLLEHERQRDLENYELLLGLVQSEYLSRGKVFEMVEKLWAVRSIEKEVYLDYRRLRDRTNVRVDRMRAQIAQHKSIVDQYELTCGQWRGEGRRDRRQNQRAPQPVPPNRLRASG